MTGIKITNHTINAVTRAALDAAERGEVTRLENISDLNDIEITDADRAIADHIAHSPAYRLSDDSEVTEKDLAYAAALGRTGWKPAPEVDPDLLEARAMAYDYWLSEGNDGLAKSCLLGQRDDVRDVKFFLEGIKRGRELAAPGWIKHDGSAVCPVARNSWVALRMKKNYRPGLSPAYYAVWDEVAFYLPIPLLGEEA